MKKELYFFKTPCIAIAVGLLLLVSLKITLAVVTIAVDINKEVFASVDDENKDASKTKASFEKDKEVIPLYYNDDIRVERITDIIHHTEHLINYKSYYHNTIITPPPDIDLQFSI